MEVYNNSLKSPLTELRACPWTELCSCSARPDKAPAELGTDRAELAQDSSELGKKKQHSEDKVLNVLSVLFLYSAGEKKRRKKKGRLIMWPLFIFRYLLILIDWKVLPVHP